MSLLASHLEQIGYSCEGIDSLPFPPPKIFTNALLSNHDITALIRDTESHERALFSVPPPQTANTNTDDSSAGARRKTVFNVASGAVTTGPPTRGTSQQHQAARRHTAVAAVLGGTLHEQVRHSDTRNVDVEILLKGAEKLCGVYELPGARERISQLRARDRNCRSTLEYYEGRVEEQKRKLEGLSAARGWRGEQEEEEEEEQGEEVEEGEVWTEEDLRREEEGVREMEAKKRELQARLRAMEKDLGGLMRM